VLRMEWNMRCGLVKLVWKGAVNERAVMFRKGLYTASQFVNTTCREECAAIVYWENEDLQAPERGAEHL
jgi:hypothetical protein